MKKTIGAAVTGALIFIDKLHKEAVALQDKDPDSYEGVSNKLLDELDISQLDETWTDLEALFRVIVILQNKIYFRCHDNRMIEKFLSDDDDDDDEGKQTFTEVWTPDKE